MLAVVSGAAVPAGAAGQIASPDIVAVIRKILDDATAYNRRHPDYGYVGDPSDHNQASTSAGSSEPAFTNQQFPVGRFLSSRRRAYSAVMSQENVEALRRIYEQMAQGNFWAAREIFHTEISWEWSSSMAGLTGVGTYHGIEGVEAATRDQFKVWDRFWQEGEKFIEAGDDVVVLTRVHGRLKGSDREVQSKAADVWTFRENSAVRFRSYDSRHEGLEAVGLTE